jgi:hypothetical protein
LFFEKDWQMRVKGPTKSVACDVCGESGIVVVKGDQQIFLCVNQQCAAYDPEQICALAEAALNLRVKAIGFGEFKRIVDTHTYFFANVSQVNVNHPLFAVKIVPPNPFEQLLPAQNPTPMFGQSVQQIKFDGG